MSKLFEHHHLIDAVICRVYSCELLLFYWFEAVLAMQIDKLLTTDSADGLTSYIIWNIWRSLGYFYPPNVSLMIDVTADIATKPRHMGLLHSLMCMFFVLLLKYLCILLTGYIHYIYIYIYISWIKFLPLWQECFCFLCIILLRFPWEIMPMG